MQLSLDRLIGRLLFVQQPTYREAEAQPEAAEAGSTQAEGAERAFGLSLLFSGVRCILQYVVLPFILPLIGVAGAFSAYLTLLINLVAIAALIFSVRRFWQIDYRYKWQYLGVAVVALVLLVAFLVLDVQAVLAL